MKSLRLTGLSLAFATLGCTAGYLMLPERAPAAAALPSIRVLGRIVTPGPDARAAAASIARTFLRERVTISSNATVTEQQGEIFRQREELRSVDRTRGALG